MYFFDLLEKNDLHQFVFAIYLLSLQRFKKNNPFPALRAPSDTYSEILNLRLPQGAREKIPFLAQMNSYHEGLF